jgi:hypothetical protein
MWFKENWGLLLIVCIAWLVAGLLYYFSTTRIEDLNTRATKIIEYALSIKDDKSSYN